jgi:phage terminase large subunit-like protein
MSLTAAEEVELLTLTAQTSHLDFIAHCWKKLEPFTPGFHTRAICARLDQAFEDFRAGIDTRLLINVHHRSGKSDIVSRYLGPHFLGEFPEDEVMQVSYAFEKAQDFSTFARGVMESPRYKATYPGTRLAGDANRKDHFITSGGGGLMATGLYGHMTGSGFALGILDDYCSGRAEAESAVRRETAWNAFKDDFMTRMAPVSIIVVMATWWNEDDVSGRIRCAMKEDPEFPQFDILEFPAKAEDYKGPGEYPGKYLFLERLPEHWYKEQYATLGKYSSAAIMDCSPKPRVGGRFTDQHIEWLDKIPEAVNYDGKPLPLKLRWARVWDLAHTAKQRGGDDPDWTSGTRLSFELRHGDSLPHLWVAHVVRSRDEAPERDKKIKAAVGLDGAHCRQSVESSLDAKDAYPYFKAQMPGTAWEKIDISFGDKATRAVPLEAIFEAEVPHVHVVRGDWNDAWIDEVTRFDGLGNTHDDQVDNLSAGYIMFIGKPRINVGNPVAARLGL